MMCGGKVCVSLITLSPPTIPFLCSIFQNCNLGRQLCREPQSIFMGSCTLSHNSTTASFTRSVLQTPRLRPRLCDGVILHHRCFALPQLALWQRRRGELLTPCSALTPAPTAAGQTCSAPFHKHTQLAQTNRAKQTG